jgi:hypothetical protein
MSLGFFLKSEGSGLDSLEGRPGLSYLGFGSGIRDWGNLGISLAVGLKTEDTLKPLRGFASPLKLSFNRSLISSIAFMALLLV